MIKANELRLGNWVDLFDSETGHNFVQATYSLLNAENFIDPIPLTPEILERCGFNFDEVQMNIPGHDYEFVFDKDGLKYGYHGEDGFIRETRQPMLYLHQLQNLYFALTGEELEIKL